MEEFRRSPTAFYLGASLDEATALIGFTEADGILTIHHTEVDDIHRGQGIGHRLVERVVAYARESGQKVVARCEFARKAIDRNPGYRDVLA